MDVEQACASFRAQLQEIDQDLELVQRQLDCEERRAEREATERQQRANDRLTRIGLVCLNRLELASKRRLEGALQEAMAPMAEVRRLHAIDHALAGLAALKKSVDETKPTSLSQLEGFMAAAVQVVEMAKTAQDLDASIVPALDALDVAVQTLSAMPGDGWHEELFRSLSVLAEAASGACVTGGSVIVRRLRSSRPSWRRRRCPRTTPRIDASTSTGGSLTGGSPPYSSD